LGKKTEKGYNKNGGIARSIGQGKKKWNHKRGRLLSTVPKKDNKNTKVRVKKKGGIR